MRTKRRRKRGMRKHALLFAEFEESRKFCLVVAEESFVDWSLASAVPESLDAQSEGKWTAELKDGRMGGGMTKLRRKLQGGIGFADGRV